MKDGHFVIVGCSGVVVMMVYPNVLLHYNANVLLKLLHTNVLFKFMAQGSEETLLRSE